MHSRKCDAGSMGALPAAYDNRTCIVGDIIA